MTAQLASALYRRDMGKNPDVIESAHMVLHLMKAGMAIYGYPAVAIMSEFLRALGFRL